jgi:short-subunit dehydrogenase
MSKAMRIEAARFGVRVSALCPGAIKTPILEGGVMGRTVYDLSPARMLQWWEPMKPMPVVPFVKETLEAVAKNKGLIVIPKQNRAILRLFRLFPALEEKMATKLYEVTLAKFPEVRAGKKKSDERQPEASATA